MKERNETIRKAIEELKEVWRDEFDAAGRPLSYTPDEDLYLVIQQLEGLINGA
ncbi:MAG: hypothetical protein IPP74_15905 [Alphaproteobacteria bacterium]|nr:hypothetical protein [Alphaproteobacteria bacterium]